MALAQLQGLTPLGGSPGGGSDPNDPYNRPPTQGQQDSQGRPQRAPSSYQGPSSQGSGQTFAQMQAQGIARPAPPSPAGLAGQTAQAAGQALQNPSAYGAPQVQQAMDVLNQGLETQGILGRRRIDETMAQRGLYDSTATGDKYGQLQAQQDQARANYATQLATQAAQTYGADRSQAIQNASSVQGQQAGQGLAQQQQNLNAALGYGGLGIQEGALTGNYGGQSTLGAQQLQQGGSQFQQNLGLQQALGLGGLGVQQGQLSLAQLQNQQQYGLAGANLSLAQQKQMQDYQLGLGGLGVSQQQADTQRQGTLGQLGLGQAQLQQSGQQFGQSLAEQQAARQQQFGLSSQDLALRQQLGLGGLNLQQQQVQNQASQFGQQFGLQQLQNQQQYGLQSQAQDLARALGYGNLNLAQQTQNQNYQLQGRGLDQQQAYQQGQLGLGQNQINASLLNQQRQSIGNLAYAGAEHGTAPSQNWLDFLMSPQGQSTGSLYNLPTGGGTGGSGGGTGGSGGGTGGTGGVGGTGGTGGGPPPFSPFGQPFTYTGGNTGTPIMPGGQQGGSYTAPGGHDTGSGAEPAPGYDYNGGHTGPDGSYFPAPGSEKDDFVEKNPNSPFYGWTNAEKNQLSAGMGNRSILDNTSRGYGSFPKGSNVMTYDPTKVAAHAGDLATQAASNPKIAAMLKAMGYGG